jgi:hypothetical protein
VVPEPVMLRFTDEAKTMLTAFATDMLTLMNSLDRVRMSALAGRAAEHAMRLALIAALARDPLADEITAQDAKWAVEYVRFLVTQIVQQTRRCVADSPWEKLKLDALAAIRELGERGITARDLPKTKPFSTMKPQDRNSVLNELQQAGLIAHGRLPSQTKPRTGWGAIASEKENDV